MTHKRARIFAIVFLTLTLFLSGCQAQPVKQQAPGRSPTTPSETTLTPTQLPTPSPTPPPPPRSLVICLGSEPSSLYLYGGISRSAWSVLEAIYDGPIDLLAYQPQAVILEKIPSSSNGDAAYQPVAMQKGDEVVDIHGNLVSLQAGAQVQPSGCTTADCVITWDGASELQMDQLVVDFSLVPGITWSDGIELTAQDSVFSFTLAADKNTPVSKQLIHRTAAYQASDEHTVRWVGVPGFFPDGFDTLFRTPLPLHILQNISAKDMLTAEEAWQTPLGWGAYAIEEWQPGDHIRLKKNERYFRTAEGLPYFDDLVFRFLGEPDDDMLAALLSKECDLIDQSSLLETQLKEILQLQSEGSLTAYLVSGPEWEQLDFGITPVSYDDGYAEYYGDRPDYFADPRTRQAFAYCINRQGIVDELLLGQSSIPFSYFSREHPLFSDAVNTYPYDAEKGRNLLDQVGWKDWDANPETPLQAIGIPNIPDGTYFTVSYYTSEADLRAAVASRIKADLWTCGVQVEVSTLPVEELFLAGPEGSLFGRKFDLAQFSWVSGKFNPCLFYTSSQIPSGENNWLTLNVGGYANPAFDDACLAAQATRPDQGDTNKSVNAEAQELFTAELPVIPLYYRIGIALSRPDFCGVQMEVSARSTLWNLETLNYGDGCQ